MSAPGLVAVAHGSRDPAAAAAARAVVGAVRRERPGLAARVAFLDHDRPRLAEVARSVAGPFVVVPLLLGAAYHSRVDVPTALAGAGAADRAIRADVLGPDPLLLRGLERRLGQAGVAPGDPTTAVVLAAAGSTSPEAVDAVRALATQWRAAGWWAVTAAFASAAPPAVESAVARLRAAGAPRVAVASYLLSPGRFAESVARAGADVASAPLGAAPEVVALVLARYDAALAATPGRSRHRGGAGHRVATLVPTRPPERGEAP